MTNLPIITAPDPVLATKASALETFDDTIRRQMDDMLETMYDSNGIGLAANQVGLLNRVLVMDLDWRGEEGTRKEGNPIFMANPEIIWASEEISSMEEGCLSVPGHYAAVERPAQVRVKYLGYDGKLAELEAVGLLSHCVQHEMDHLDGLLFVDHISRLKRNMILKKLEKTKKLLL